MRSEKCLIGKRLWKIAERHDLTLVEDSCDTLGARIDNKPTGTYSDISTTSFYGSHIITGAGGGGMICVNDEAYDRRCRVLRGWGRSSAVDESEDVSKRFGIDLAILDLKHKYVKDTIGDLNADE